MLQPKFILPFAVFTLFLVIPWQPASASAAQLHATPAQLQQEQPLRQHPFTEKVILIDAGHGGIDGGTFFGNILEKDINLAISRRLYMLLRSEGIPAVLNRDQDYALSDDNRWHSSRSRHQRDLSHRKQLSNEIPTAMVVSVHVNWGSNPSKRGGLVLHQAEGRSSLLAGFIQNRLNQLYSKHERPSVGKPYYLLRRTEVPAVIVETGFLSNGNDRQLLTSRNGQVAVAEALAGGIIDYISALQL
ncbi:N-acetylmuramoyl-L-alanine amidase family protein [Paenibacillus lemnae]|uniref:N-acetylmuramoyl-L-alanine amidase n=1 Tax=Paenibacillus lemnae TaxID=1330551 RepID=A0A848M693_PAELE|nr:N-acetylmuramoyl-L-alanine amidase [Paenibacillus lemnae]NMO95343.1 N-acetylmuramoyl-L-alanine amidase [Paenibacillus lemnae]